MLSNRAFERAQARHRRRRRDSTGASEARWRALGFTRADLLLSLLRGWR